MSGRTPSQQAAIEQLQALTQGEEDVTISVLESVDWDVQRAADLIFDGPQASNSSASGQQAPSSQQIEEFEVDDSAQDNTGVYPRRPTPATWTYAISFIPNAVLAILALPFRFIAAILRFLRIPLPNISSLRFTTFSLGRAQPPTSNLSPVAQAERWVRELEEETGFSSPSSASASTAVEVGEAGSSTARQRTNANSSHHGRTLPEFLICPYDEALRRAQREAKILAVVLVSEEHDDVSEFKKTTLTDPILNNVIREHNILIWGGDVGNREAYSASHKLQTTTYPFVAFIALQPVRTAILSSHSSSSSAPSLTVLSRHSGASQTTPSVLLNHLQRTLFPRVEPFLKKIEADKRGLEHEREMRRMQDSLFEAARARDAEKMRASREAELARQQEAAQSARLAEIQAENVRKAEAQKVRRRQWSNWAKSAYASPEPSKGIRLAFRIPGAGKAINRVFSPDTSLTSLYVFVDAFVQGTSEEKSITSPPPGTPVDESGISAEDDWWGFELYTSYPRQKVEWVKGVTVGSLPALQSGGGLIVELSSASSPRASLDNNSNNVDDDGYESEE